MSPTQILVLVGALVGFVAIAIFAAWKAVRIPWPSGPRMSRPAGLGIEVVIIDAPGDTNERLLVRDACALAVTSIMTAWRAWRLSVTYRDEPEFSEVFSAPVAEEVFPLIGVHFIDDALMDDIQHALFQGEKTFAYLSDASSSFRRVPLAVIRKSLAAEVIVTGQPLMHEVLHALLNHYLPGEAGQRDHTHVAFELVQGAAKQTYLDLFAPKSPKRIV